jgi:phosphoserine phosphatase RsbU/P
MSSTPAGAAGSTSSPPTSGKRPLREFWRRVTEGRQIEDLWSQFASDARATYGFYSKEVDWDTVDKGSKWKRPLRAIKALFMSLLMKLSPARRVLLLLALLFLVLSGLGIQGGDKEVVQIKFEVLAALLLFLLLALELADRVTMKRDLEIAREIQSWLVPSAPPVVPGAQIAFATRPQNTVAGDYYDAFFRGKADGTGGQGRLLLVVADVAGKSIPAGLLMATFQASLHALATLPTSVGELVTGLNDYACGHSLDGRRFTTALLAEMDPASRELSYISAGHNAPILLRASGRIERLQAGGLPLGIDAKAVYETGSLRLEHGDTLVVFTDGVVEAENDSEKDFGEQRLLETIQQGRAPDAATMLKNIMSSVDSFVGTARQHDDITCLVLRID